LQQFQMEGCQPIRRLGDKKKMNRWCSKYLEDKRNWIKTLIYMGAFCWLALHKWQNIYVDRVIIGFSMDTILSQSHNPVFCSPNVHPIIIQAPQWGSVWARWNQYPKFQDMRDADHRPAEFHSLYIRSSLFTLWHSILMSRTVMNFEWCLPPRPVPKMDE
jgi:hypothetical protein